MLGFIFDWLDRRRRECDMRFLMPAIAKRASTPEDAVRAFFFHVEIDRDEAWARTTSQDIMDAERRIRAEWYRVREQSGAQ